MTVKLVHCLTILLLAGLVAAPAALAGRVNRAFTTVGETRFVVPEGVTSVTVVAVGAPGGLGAVPLMGSTPPVGGRGARVQGTLAVSPGQELFVNVGVGGGRSRTFDGAPYSGDGGGGSDVRLCPTVLPPGGCVNVPGTSGSISTRVLVAGGGGGAGANRQIGPTPGTAGGNGGDAGLLGAGASPGQSLGNRTGGAGATVGGGGAGGQAPGWAPGAAGEQGRGGDGGRDTAKFAGAGGGGGGFGGGGSASSATSVGGPTAGGGGGSSFANATPFLGATVPSTVTATSSALSSDGAPSVTLIYDDAIAPGVAVSSPVDGAVVGARPTIQGTAGTAPGDASQVSVGVLGPPGSAGAFRVTVPVAPDGTFSVQAPAPLTAGVWRLDVAQSDDGANVGSASVAFTVDALAPTLALNDPASGAFVGTPTLSLRGVAGTKAKDEKTVGLRVAAGAVTAATLTAPVGVGGAFEAVTPPLADGAYTVTATQRDDGQGETTTAPVSFVIDTRAPTIDLPFLDGTEVSAGTSLALFYSCADGGSGIASCDGPRPSGALIPTSAPGVFTDTITATDRAQNTTSRSVTYTVRAAPAAPAAPVASAPATGPAGAGAQAARTSPGLRIASARRGAVRRGRVALTVRGTALATAAGQLLTVTARKGRRVVRARTTLRSTRWRVVLRLPAGTGRWTVSASLPGSASLLPATARRTVRIR